MDYIELVKEIESQGITKLPALLIVVAEQCVKKKVFQPGGMERVISRIASQPTNKQEQEGYSSICIECGGNHDVRDCNEVLT